MKFQSACFTETLGQSYYFGIIVLSAVVFFADIIGRNFDHIEGLSFGG